MSKEQRDSILPPEIVGSHEGRFLLEQGYTGFEPSRIYTIGKPDEHGIVEVRSECGESWDDDGFDRETYYDWWFMDEALKPIPGVWVFHDFSYRERWTDHADFFSKERFKAMEVLKQRKEINHDDAG